MYHFVKIRFCRENKAYWYLKPECKQDIEDHFNIIINKDIAMGTYEHINSEHIYKSSDGSLRRTYTKEYDTDWNSSVSRINYILEEDWNFTALKLRSKTFDSRIEDFENGKNILVLTERIEHMEYFKEKLCELTNNLFIYHGGLGKKVLKKYDELKEEIIELEELTELVELENDIKTAEIMILENDFS